MHSRGRVARVLRVVGLHGVQAEAKHGLRVRACVWAVRDILSGRRVVDGRLRLTT